MADEIEMEQPEAVRGKPLRRAMGLVTLAWVFGSVWSTSTAGAPLTEFARGLGTSNLQFGILSALPFIASLICVPASAVIDRTGARKAIFLATLYLQRLSWVPIAMMPVWMLHRGGSAASWSADVFLCLLFVMYALGNCGSPAWVRWMADLVPERLRGKYFSVRKQAGIITAIPAAALVGIMMDRHAHIQSELMGVCMMVFLWTVPFGLADIHLFQYVPGIPKAPRTTHWMASLGKALANRQFLWFGGFVATLTFAISFMGQFVTLYLEEQIHANNLSTQLITLVAPMVAQLLILNVWGKAVDRIGKKPVLAMASLGLVPVGLGWCFMSTDRVWLGYLLSALGGGLWCGIEVANFNLVLEMSDGSVGPATQSAGSAQGGDDPGDSSFYAVNNVIINVAGCFGGLAAGVIADAFSKMQWQPVAGWKPFTFYDILFALSAFLRLAAAIVFLPKIVEPAARPTREALRFMTANIYNNLWQAVLQPMRVMGKLRGGSYRADEE